MSDQHHDPTLRQALEHLREEIARNRERDMDDRADRHDALLKELEAIRHAQVRHESTTDRLARDHDALKDEHKTLRKVVLGNGNPKESHQARITDLEGAEGRRKWFVLTCTASGIVAAWKIVADLVSHVRLS